MTDPNVFEPEWEIDRGTVRASRVGAAAGGRDLGAALYELDPGAQATPYHLHYANEELLVVLSGAPELRTPAGKRTLAPGAVVAFPTGPGGAHRLRNTGDAPCRYLIVSTMRYPEICEQIDTGTMLGLRPDGDGWAWPEGSEADYRTLFEQAIEADD